jgi:carbon-monoxide dehydrogenase small subunit
MMTRELLDRIPDPTDDDIRQYLSGNLCRCAAYSEILQAVRSVARSVRAVR